MVCPNHTQTTRPNGCFKVTQRTALTPSKWLSLGSWGINGLSRTRTGFPILLSSMDYFHLHP